MMQVLLSNQRHDKQPLPGHFFTNSDDDIKLSPILNYLDQRVRLSSGRGQDIDILAAFSGQIWVCQSKWQESNKVGVDVLHMMMRQADTVRERFDPIPIILWLFAHNGLTEDAAELAEAEGILWSDRSQLDGLLTYLDLRMLPDLEGV